MTNTAQEQVTADASALTTAAAAMQQARVDLNTADVDLKAKYPAEYALVHPYLAKVAGDLQNPESAAETAAASARTWVTDNPTPAPTPIVTVPGAPTNLVATAGNGQIALSWDAPSSDGGAAIAGYVVSDGTVEDDTTGTTYTLSGLTNGTEYELEVAAENSAGTGTAVKVSATPVAPTPTPTPSGALPAPAAAVVAALGKTPTDLVFSDYFPGTTLDTSKWNPWMADAAYGRWSNQGKLSAPFSAAANTSNDPLYDAEYDSPSQITVDDGLTITAVPNTAEKGYTWVSGCICTEGLFKFGPGSLVRVTMQEPSEAGAWPGIWFLDGSSEVDLQEGGYVEGAATNADYSLAANYHGSGDSQTIKEAPSNLTTGLHLYELAYDADGTVTMFLDGVKTASYSGVSGDFEIIINLQVAINSTGWHPVVESGTTEMVMKVGAVEVWT